MGGPTLEDVTKAVCPDGKPYKCLPHGSCFAPDSYCDPRSEAVESCFPHRLTTLESKLAYCQDISQNISKIMNNSCRFACKIISEGCDKPQVCESCEDVVMMWKSTAFALGILCIILMLLGLFFYLYKIKKWRNVYRQVIRKRRETKADGGEKAEGLDLGVQPRNSCDERENLLPAATDVDVGGVTPPENQTQNQQPRLTQQDLLDNSPDNLHLQQPSLNNGDSGEMPPSYSSGNASSVSSPSSSSVSSVGTSDDSGLGPGGEGRFECVTLGQQSSQTLTNQNGGSSQQSQSERATNLPYVTSTSIPEGKSTLVTSASGYRE